MIIVLSTSRKAGVTYSKRGWVYTLKLHNTLANYG